MNTNEQFEKLREQLNTLTTWPSEYMFKFIIHSDNHKLALIESKFTKTDIITTHESKNGKYVSITIKSYMPDADAVINKYKELQGIEGIISL